MGVQYIPATSVDVLELAKVHNSAFISDTFSQFMQQNKPSNAHQGLMEKSLNIWFQAPDSKVLKAVDSEGNIVGWTCWLVKELPLPAAQEQPPQEKQQQSNEQKQSAPPQLKPEQALGRQMGTDAQQWEKKHMEGKKYLVLQALATDPAHQGQGIGSKLVQLGTNIADSEGLACWTHASPDSYRIYGRAGFEEMGSSEYDLDEFAQDPEKSWGTYTFRYMLRPSRQ